MILNSIKNVAKTLFYLNIIVLLVFTLQNFGPHIPSTYLHIKGDMEKETISNFIKDLKLSMLVNKVLRRSVLNINIDSGGGDIFESHNILIAMQEAKDKGNTIVCHVIKAGSMAFTLLQYCDIRIGTENSILMQHMPHHGEGFENMELVFKEDINTYAFTLRLHRHDESRRLGISLDEHIQRYMFSKWYKGSDACKDNALDYIYKGSTKEMIPCSVFTAERDALKKRLHDKASNAKIGR